MTLKILITGGTFDKEYDEIKGSLYFKETHMTEILELGRSRVDVNIEKLMLIDSLDMTPNQRELIVSKCIDSEEDQIVITHGTDTMTITGKMLAEKKMDKTIVLTGAMIPYKFGSSDGLFNLGGAIAYAQSLSSGVYIAMNGQFFEWDKVEKNREKGVFESIERR
ncbi:MAG: asparaginase [Candidatus Marinimicrobia bacterium]|nr:asparaginase [Candidatus Neomarinimicrobiota bacterium]|tara:strand:+ start:422 stop:916 length:495 start_codon:yes stop_codon:yes gene_type:complete